MPITLCAATRVVVVAVAVDEYDAAAGSDEAAFEALTGITGDLQRLHDLCSTPLYRNAGFEMLAPLRGVHSADLLRQLRDLRRDLDALGRELQLLLLWTGHGEMVDDELRLVTRECTRPLHASDGLAPAELIAKLSLKLAGSVTLLLDVCQAAAAAAPVLAGAAKRLRSSQADAPYFAGALFAAYPFQPAWDGVFIDALTRLLRVGPSPAARQRMAERRAWRFHERDSELTLADVSEVLLIELELLRAERQTVSDPVLTFVNQPPRLFPNPLFVEHAPAQIVDVAQRRRALAADIDTHFLPKARGLDPSEEGWTFAGRQRSSAAIVQWLQGQGPAAQERLLVLTGSGGSGKSALIGRLVTLSDRAARELARQSGWDEAADQAAATVPAPESIDATLHLRRLGTEQVMQALAELLAMPLAQGRVDPASFVAQVPTTQTLPSGHTRPTTFVLDALDEANDPARIAQSLIAALLRRGCRVLVGTRRSAAYKDAPQLLPLLGCGHVIDLDHDPDTLTDLRSYVQRRLATSMHAAQAPALARAVAERADGRFLYARMAVSVLLRQPQAVTVAALAPLLGQGIGQALLHDLRALDAELLQVFPAIGGQPATALFAALAYAEGAGLPLRDGLWPALAQALLPGDQPLEATHAMWLLREGGRFIVEDGEFGQAVYRLYHQALVDELRQQHGPGRLVQARLARCLQTHARTAAGWARANPYAVAQVLRHVELARNFDVWSLQALDFEWIRAFVAQLGVHALVAQYESALQGEPMLMAFARPDKHARFMRCAVVATALRQSSAVLAADPRQITTHLLGRLRPLPRGLADVGDFLDEAAAQTPRPWLRPLTAALAQEQSIRWVRPADNRGLTNVAFSQGGRFAVHSSFTEVQLWNLEQWQELGLLCNADHRPMSLAVSDDGLTLVYGDYDGRVGCWRRGRMHDVVRVHEPQVNVRRIVVSADGRYALSATGGSHNALVAWDFDADRHDVVWDDASVGIDAFALGADGRTALIARSDGWLMHMRLWPRGEVGRHRLDAGAALQLALSEDRTLAAVACRNGKVQLLLLGRDAVLLAQFECESVVSALAWSPDNTRLYVGCEDGRVQAWAQRAEDKKRTWHLVVDHARGHTGPVLGLGVRGTRHDSFVSADNLHIKEWRAGVAVKLPQVQPLVCAEAGLLAQADGGAVLGFAENALRRWDLARASVTPPIAKRSLLWPLLRARAAEAQSWQPQALLRAANATRALAVGDDRIEVWDSDTLTRLACRSGQRYSAAAISSDGGQVAFFDQSRVQLWDIANDRVVALSSTNERPRRLCFSPDGQQLLGIGLGPMVVAWTLGRSSAAAQTADVQIRAELYPSHGLFVGNRRAIVASGDGRLFMIDTRDPDRLSTQTLEGHQHGNVDSLLLAADGRHLVTASYGGALALWDLDAGCQLQRFDGAGGNLHQLSEPFGHVLLSTFHGVLRMVSLSDGQPRLSFQADHQIVAAAADPGLKRIAAADQSGLLHLLHVVDNEPVADD